MIGFRLKANSLQGKRFIDKLAMNKAISKNVIDDEPYLVEYLFIDKNLQKIVKPFDVPNFLKSYAKMLRFSVQLGADYDLIILDDDS